MTNPRRHRDARDHRFTISVPTRDDPTRVVCPDCEAKAVVLPDPSAGDDAVKAVCAACGFVRRADGTVRRFYWHADNPTDGYVGLDLWLTTRCAGHSLWAFNQRHLDVLDSYVSASLRERRPDPKWGWRNASIISRLPRWMTKASNREAVRKGLRTLRDKL